MKKLLLILILFTLSFVVISCGDGQDIQNEDIEYVVKFSGTDLQDINVKKGEKLLKPIDPVKADHIFGGWYLDSTFNNEVQFPLEVTNNMIIYAKFNDYKEAFKYSRNKTIGDQITGYEYDYTIDAVVSYSGLSLKGNTTGNSKYSKNNKVQFYDVHTNSGVLFIDGSKYQIKSGTTLQKLSINEKNEITKFLSEEVGEDYKFDSSCFAKPLFEYSDDKLKSIESTSIPNEYKLNTSFNVSTAISILGNYLNHPIVEKIIGELPETSVNTGVYVKFNNGELKTYRYEMQINVTNLTLELTYNLEFKNIGIEPSIIVKEFNDISFTDTTINSTKQKIDNLITRYKNDEKSSYNFTFNTGLDYGLTFGEINATFKGSSTRKISNGNIYFYNDIEIDSDYKNKDLYENNDIKDIHIKKTKLLSEEVYIIEKKILKDETYLQKDYINNENDNYYLMDAICTLTDISFIQELSSNSNEKIYIIGLKNDSIIKLLSWINQNMELDPLKNSETPVKIFGDFNDSTLRNTSVDFEIIETNGQLKAISININGYIETKLVGSNKFDLLKEAEFKIELQIDVTNDYVNYEPFEEVNDAK